MSKKVKPRFYCGVMVVKDDEVPQPKCAHVAAENGSKKKTPAVVSQSKKLGEVQEIYEKLHSKHTSYDQEQLRMWAHLIQMGKHDSYEVPPYKPFFKNTKSQKKLKLLMDQHKTLLEHVFLL